MGEFYDLATSKWWPEGEYYALKASREPVVTMSDLPRPYVAGDIPEYQSMASGKMITSRSHQREDLKRTGCRILEPSEFKPEYRKPHLEKRYSKAARKGR